MDMLPFLQEVVDSGHIMSLFLSNQANSALRVIDFAHDPPKNDFQHNTYRVMLHDDIPKAEVVGPSYSSAGAAEGGSGGSGFHSNLVCVFPGHSNKSKRLLQSKAYGRDRDAFNIELNERFLATPEWDEVYKDKRFLILYGSHTYWCKGITGSIYVVWAEYVTRINAGNTASIPFKNIPIVLNCNRKYGVKAMYILRPAIENKPLDLSLMPKAPGNPRLLFDTRHSPFVCEMRPDQVPPKRVQTVSKQEAYAMVTQSTRDPSEWVAFERVPFSRVDVGMLEIETNTASSGSWVESPREMFIASSPGGAGGGSKLTLIKENDNNQPPRLDIRGTDEPDPFSNTADQEEMDEISSASFSRGAEIELEDL